MSDFNFLLSNMNNKMRAFSFQNKLAKLLENI